MKRLGGVKWLALVGLCGVACANPVAEDEGTGGTGSTGNSGGSAGSSQQGSGSSTGSGSTSGNGGGAGSSTSNPDPTVTIPGINPNLDTPPAGCLRGSQGGVLALDLDANVPAAELEAVAGIVHANGKPCTDADGEPLALSALYALQITGGSEDNGVVLDLGSGDWSGLLATPESLLLSLSEGENGLLVRGTAGEDRFRHAMRGQDVVLDLAGNASLHLVASGLSELGFSLGEGDDRLEELLPILEGTEPAVAAELSPLSRPILASGGAGNDWLVGGSSDDEFEGGPGDDVVSGLDGADYFQSDVEGDGTDVWNGGPGYDGVSYDLRSENLELATCLASAVMGCSGGSCVCSTQSGGADEGDRLINVEELGGGTGDDILRGTEASDTLRGGPGDDVLTGLGGSDLLSGGTGLDQLEGGPDGDICDGQEGETISSCEI
jgi:Ca2+-binding RTX toxin-like protein